MTRGLFRLFVAVLTLLGSVVMVAGTTAVPAAAQPSGSSTTTPRFVKLAVDSVTPSTVTPASEPVLTVAGTVTNIGDRPVQDVSVRLQRAAAVSEPSQLRSTLQLDQVNFDLVGPFEDVVEELSPGQRRQFTVSIPLYSDVAASLQIIEPGVYPVLVNVNGTPAYGGQARLDDARFLLPVLGVPQFPDTHIPPSPAPVATTMIWPLADRPRMVGGITGGPDSTVVLTDDELAGSLATGGRLDQLLGTLETVVGTGRSRDEALASSVCLAIDPDLLLTAQAMTSGYRVLASPSDPDGATRQGSGGEQAAAWLERLRALAPTLCTVALPFAQVDPAALAAVGDPALTTRALAEPAEIVDAVLGVRSVRGVALPDAGELDHAGASLLRAQGYGTALLAGTSTVPEGTAGAESALTRDYTYGGTWAAPDPAPAPELVRVPQISAEPVAPAAPAPQAPPPAPAPPSALPPPPPPPPAGPPRRGAPHPIW
ncbi:DUF6049 family protein, partial [Nocardia farcinica]|uniref:DUF6049 family protein n=1 Tax=Nocardia farcinica TaxID=37329 RepID=UPI00245762C7